MASNSLFLSIMTPPTSAGTITLYFNAGTTSGSYASTSTNPPDTDDDDEGELGLPEEFNLTPSAIFSVPITVSGTEDERTLAQEIFYQLGAYMIANNYNYQGWLSYAEEAYPATFQVTCTDHCVCVWSQTILSIKVTGNTTGCVVLINKSPALETLQEALDNAPFVGWDFKTEQGVNLNDTQIMKGVLDSSSLLTSKYHNNIVMSTYAKEYKGNDTDTIKLYPKPLVDFDQPRIRRKNILDVYNLPQWGKFAYFVNHDRSGLTFRFSETMIDNREPFGKDNLVYVSYISGVNSIPEEVKLAIIELMRWKQANRNNLRSVKGGTGAFEFFESFAELRRILSPISQYKNRLY